MFALKGRLPSWTFRLPALIGWLLLAALIVAAALARFRAPSLALSEWDSWGWLSPALGWIGGTGFRETYEREWLYGAFIAFCLRATGSFSGYILIQQILGLAASVVMWVTWRLWISLLPRHLLLEIVSTVAGLFVIAIYLFSPIARALEMGIRPEAIMAFVAFSQLLCIVGFIKYRWHEPRPVAAVILGALSLPLAYAMFVLKPNWALAVPATTLPVILGLLGRGPSPLFRALPVALGFAVIALTLWLPDKLLFIRASQTRVVLAETLFTIHADIIQKHFADELASPGTAPDRRKFLEEIAPVLDREMINARAEKIYYKRLGFDPDYLMYRASLLPLLESRYQMTPPEIAAFCRGNFVSAVLHRPLDYARKAGWQMEYFTCPDDSTFFRKRIDLKALYASSLKTLPVTLDPATNPATQAIYQTFLDTVGKSGPSAPDLETIPTFRDFLKSFRFFAPWIMGAFLAALAASLAWKALAPLRLAGLAALVIFAAPAGNALTVALVHALDNNRYRGSYGPLLLFALAVFCVFLAVFLVQLTLALRRRQNAAS